MNPDLWMSEAQRLRERGEAFALVTVLKAIAPTSAKPGDKAVVTAQGRIVGWIGGGCAQPAVIKTVRRALRDGLARQIRITPKAEGGELQLEDVLEFGMACHSGGTLELFIDPILPATPLLVIGDSPVARALLDLAPRVGFAVNLLAFGGRSDDYPQAQRVLTKAEELASAWGTAGWVVVATQGRLDMEGLAAALSVQPRTCWFVASERKAQVLKRQLIESGQDRARVEAIIAPAGERIGAQTPEEIALAVLGSVVAARRRQASPMEVPTHSTTEV
ncbi:MAG: XdhC family protein [Limnohabitans sp.]|nr:XdhC family protein [Limnohabitans sp.]